MKVSKVFAGQYLAAADLGDEDITATIAKVEVKEFEDGNKLLLTFREDDIKPLVANKTNSNRVAHLYGDDTDGWIGKRITLYRDLVDYQGKTVEAVRVRPPPKNAAPRPVRQSDDYFTDDPGH